MRDATKDQVQTPPFMNPMSSEGKGIKM